jgi:drug/metabolite transporter (DMT)-like permease
MNITTLPSDSLYKWLSTFGLLISISSAYLFFSYLWERKDSIQPNIEEISFLSNASAVFLAIGFLISLLGFTLWYFKLQRHIDLEVKARTEEQIAKTELAQLQHKKENTQQKN